MCKLNVRQAAVDIISEGVEDYLTPSYRLQFYNWRAVLGEDWHVGLYNTPLYESVAEASKAAKEKAAELAAMFAESHNPKDWYICEPVSHDWTPCEIEGYFDFYETWGCETITAYVWVEEVWW